MSDDETQVEQSAEEIAEVEEEPTEEAAEENESSEEVAAGEEAKEEQPDELTKARKVAEDQRKRAEKAEAELKKLKPKPQTDRTDGQDLSALEQRVVRAELAAAGVKHPDDQKYVIEAAKRLGVEPNEAATDEIVAAKLERMRGARETKDATPAPNKRGTSSGTSDVARLADKVEKGGALPSDPATAEKVQKEIARRSQERA